MRNIKIEKKEMAELEVVEAELLSFVTLKFSKLASVGTGDKYLSEMLLLDIAQQLFYSFRTKVERLSAKPNNRFASFTVSVAEAVTLVQVCFDPFCDRDDYRKHVMSRLGGELHKHLISLNIPVNHKP